MKLNLYESDTADVTPLWVFFCIYYEADNRALYHYSDHRLVIGGMLRAHQSLVDTTKSTTTRDRERTRLDQYW